MLTVEQYKAAFPNTGPINDARIQLCLDAAEEILTREVGPEPTQTMPKLLLEWEVAEKDKNLFFPVRVESVDYLRQKDSTEDYSTELYTVTPWRIAARYDDGYTYLGIYQRRRGSLVGNILNFPDRSYYLQAKVQPASQTWRNYASGEITQLLINQRGFTSASAGGADFLAKDNFSIASIMQPYTPLFMGGTGKLAHSIQLAEA